MKLKDMKRSNKILVFSLLILLTATVLFGKNVTFYYTQGIITFNAGNYPKAEEYLKTALMLEPSLENNSDIKYMIGLSAWYSGDLVTARAYLPEEDISIAGSSNKVSKRNLVNNIAHWEKMGIPVVTNKKDFQKKKLSPWIDWLTFLGIFSTIMVIFMNYKHSKKKKSQGRSIPSQEEKEESFLENEGFPAADFSFNAGELPSDVPADDEIKKKLQTLLQGDKSTHNENMARIEEPEKIVEKVGSEASEEELTDLTKAVQEILSKKSESSRT